jgi:hypothetical protein
VVAWVKSATDQRTAQTDADQMPVEHEFAKQVVQLSAIAYALLDDN